MIDCAYNKTSLYNLAVVRETKRWFKHGIITENQFENIRAAHVSSLYSPNFVIRILLLLATLLAISGVTGLLALGVYNMNDKTLAIGLIVYGIVSFVILEQLFIKTNNHYKSGVTEALLYHSMGFTIGGIIYLLNYDNVSLVLIICLVIFVFAAIRYIDLLSTIAAVAAFAALLFYEMYELDGVFRQVIPFAFIIVFTLLYFVAKSSKEKKRFEFWRTNILIIESISLLLIYVGGNYLVVRELSVEMMNLDLTGGQDIPFAMIFYVLTVIIPAAYLYFGIKNKDVVLLRISLLLIAFSAFTFKYYFSFGHPEITLTIAGAVVLLITLAVMNYLKVTRNGYTRENLLSEKWADMNLEAFIISQTLGGNAVTVPDQVAPGGGSFGGGGASDSF